MNATHWYRWDGDTLIIQVQARPRASRDEIVGVYGDHLKIRITAPPVEGQANARLTAFLATCFGLPKSRVALLQGQKGKTKVFALAAPTTLPPALAITRRAAPSGEP